MDFKITGCVADEIKQKIYKSYLKYIYTNDILFIHMVPIDDYIKVEVTTTLGERRYHKCRRKMDGTYESIDLPGNDR